MPRKTWFSIMLIFTAAVMLTAGCNGKSSEEDASMDAEEESDASTGDMTTDETGDGGDIPADMPPDEEPGDPATDLETDEDAGEVPADMEEEEAAAVDMVEDVPEEEASEEDMVEDIEQDEVAVEDAVEDEVEDVGEEEIIEGFCGDGALDPEEACDDGNTENEPCDTTDPNACLGDCSLLMAECGDGGEYICGDPRNVAE